MATNAAAAGAQQHDGHGRSSPLPPWLLLNTEAYVGRRSNATTAAAEGRHRHGHGRLTVEASLWPAPPPLPSDVHLFCGFRPGAEFP
ncbi:hypothetical protein ACP4OV_007309 [Aristida adscensionis]